MTEVKYPNVGGSGNVTGATNPITFTSGIIGFKTDTSTLTEYLLKSGGVMTGQITLSADATLALHPITKQQLDAINTNLSGLINTNASNISTNTSDISTNASNISVNITNISNNTSNISTNTTDISTLQSSKLDLSGGTMTGNIVLSGDPTLALHPSTKQYVDGIETSLNNSISTNTSNISGNSSSISLNAGAISSNSSDISTLNSFANNPIYANDLFVKWRNNADSADLNVIKVDTSDNVILNSINDFEIITSNLFDLSVNYSSGVSGGHFTIGNTGNFNLDSVGLLTATFDSSVSYSSNYTSGSSGSRILLDGGNSRAWLGGAGASFLDPGGNTSQLFLGGAGEYSRLSHQLRTYVDGSNSRIEVDSDEITLVVNGAPKLNIFKDYVYSHGIRDYTTGSSSNVYIDPSLGIIYRSTSSKRYKTNIEPLDKSYRDKALELQPVWYRSNTKTTKDKGNLSWYGLIAEEVAKTIPQIVHYSQDEEGKERAESVMYDRLSVFNLSFVKEHEQEIKLLKKEIQKLKNRK